MKNYKTDSMIHHSDFMLGEVTLPYRPKITRQMWLHVETSQDAWQIFKAHWNPDTICLHEEFKVLYLNRRRRVIGFKTVGIGGMGFVCLNPQIIFVTALLLSASRVVLAHNHPSGSANPSKVDIILLDKCHQAAQLLKIKLQDHLIITGGNDYYSWQDAGRL